MVIGAGGGIGAALLAALREDPSFAAVRGLSRRSDPPLDLLDEGSIEQAARHLRTLGLPLRLVVDATGFLHGPGMAPEKSWRALDPKHLAHAFALNAIGPALLMKHLLPQLATDGPSVMVSLSAKVGSIGDNRLGGWYAYRASKAALNQLVRTAAIELRRVAPLAVCAAVHPGTVATDLSAPFAKHGLKVQTPAECATRLLALVHRLGPQDSGGFFATDGSPLPW